MTMASISEGAEQYELDNISRSSSGPGSHASAPMVLEAHAHTRLEPSRRRHYAQSVHNNTFTHLLGDTPPERCSSGGPGSPSRSACPRAQYSDNTSLNSSSTMLTVSIPHLGSVARVPRQFQHQHQQCNRITSATSSSSRTAVRDVSREAQRSAELKSYAGSPRGVLSAEQADLEAARLDISDIEGGRRKKRTLGSLKRCLFSCLECWFGWENGKVYYGMPTTRPVVRPAG